MRSRRLWQWALAALALAAASVSTSGCEAIIGAEERRLLVGVDGASVDSQVINGDGSRDGSLLLSTNVEVVATGQAGPRGIAVDDKSVYWANQTDGTIGAWEKSGSAPRVFARGATTPRWVSLDATQVFWNSDTLGGCVPAILKLPKNAAPDAGPIQVAGCNDAMDRINGMGVDGTFLYWTTHIASTALYAVAKEGGQFSALKKDLGGQPDALSVTSEGIYWMNPPNGTVARYDKATQAVTLLAADLKGLGAIAAENGYVYFATSTNVFRITTTASADAGTSTETVASGQDGPTSLALFGEHVYWVNAGSGLVVRAPRVGGTVETIASQQAGLRSIAVDSSGVYFARDTGEVSRVLFR